MRVRFSISHLAHFWWVGFSFRHNTYCITLSSFLLSSSIFIESLIQIFNVFWGTIQLWLQKPWQGTSKFNSMLLCQYLESKPDRFHHLFRSCTETKYESNPWWAVEFDKPTIVTIVRITNRGDCCGIVFLFWSELNAGNHHEI